MLLSGLASAADPDVPDWAQDWKDTFLSAREQGTLKLTGALSTKFLTAGDQELFAVLELSTIDFPPGEPSPAGVAIIIDRSASTAGRRLLLAKKAALAILAGLTEQDYLTVIRVSNNAESLPLQKVTAENREKMRVYIEEMRAEGRSDLSAGLDAALEEFSALPEGNYYRQVIMLSDGQPTEGEVDADGLAALAREVREKKNVHLSTVAIGDDANVEVMAGMAKEGWGFAARLNDASGVERVAQRQRLELVRRAADKTTVRLKLESNVRVLEVLGHESVLKGNTLTIPVGELGPAEVLPIVVRLSVTVAGKQARRMALAHLEIQYENALTERTRLQNLSLSAEVNPPKANRPGAFNSDPLHYAARAIVQRNLAQAEELANDGDKAGARQLLDETRPILQRMSGQGPFDGKKELALLEERGAELTRKYSLASPSKQAAKPKKKR
jgi:Ca-activated chloride channel family protein